jgi:hypothetical protein
MVANELLEASSEEAEEEDTDIMASSLKPVPSNDLEEAILDDKYQTMPH